MKIDNSVKSVGRPAGASRNSAAKPAAGGGAASATAAAAPAASSAVELSPMAARLQTLSDNLANTPVFDAGRVSEIKQAIAEGRFKMDAGKVADGLMAGVRQMLSAQR